ncbi:hypothetical protein CEXT_93831 [Caerostris extrusa]|uniref:Uncharacterized protein n=1 Tax=Caerostris extrusa TaxID=172846 RepID=A0AAV4P7U0_CAEEX|nr:hypothetical protein CEXT_93831 [Caerostris extrusa]
MQPPSTFSPTMEPSPEKNIVSSSDPTRVNPHPNYIPEISPPVQPPSEPHRTYGTIDRKQLLKKLNGFDVSDEVSYNDFHLKNR